MQVTSDTFTYSGEKGFVQRGKNVKGRRCTFGKWRENGRDRSGRTPAWRRAGMPRVAGGGRRGTLCWGTPDPQGLGLVARLTALSSGGKIVEEGFGSVGQWWIRGRTSECTETILPSYSERSNLDAWKAFPAEFFQPTSLLHRFIIYLIHYCLVIIITITIIIVIIEICVLTDILLKYKCCTPSYNFIVLHRRPFTNSLTHNPWACVQFIYFCVWQGVDIHQDAAINLRRMQYTRLLAFSD
jgi:hypothetical protein